MTLAISAAAIAAAGNMAEGISLERLFRLNRQTAQTLSGVLVAAFMGMTALGVRMGAARDGAMVRTAHFAIESVVPVVGGSVSESLDALLESAERETPGSLRLDAGRCRVCETCARRKEKPCRFPEKLRYSLESLGGNVSALAADKLGAPVLWGSREAPPEYFVLVGAVLTKEE